MTIKLLISYTIFAVSAGVFLYFAYSLIRFAVVGRRTEKPGTIALTAFAFSAVLTSAGLWFWARHRFVDDLNWYFKERLVVGAGVTLCVIAIALSRFAARRTSIPVIVAGLLVALNWIGSIVRD